MSRLIDPFLIGFLTGVAVMLPALLAMSQKQEKEKQNHNTGDTRTGRSGDRPGIGGWQTDEERASLDDPGEYIKRKLQKHGSTREDR